MTENDGKVLPFMYFDMQGWAARTPGATRGQRLALFDAIRLAWLAPARGDAAGTLPDDDPTLAAMLDTADPEELKLVRRHFRPVPECPGMLRCDWLVASWEESFRRHDAASRAGKASAAKRRARAEVRSRKPKPANELHAVGTPLERRAPNAAEGRNDGEEVERRNFKPWNALYAVQQGVVEREEDTSSSSSEEEEEGASVRVAERGAGAPAASLEAPPALGAGMAMIRQAIITARAPAPDPRYRRQRFMPVAAVLGAMLDPAGAVALATCGTAVEEAWADGTPIDLTAPDWLAALPGDPPPIPAAEEP